MNFYHFLNAIFELCQILSREILLDSLNEAITMFKDCEMFEDCFKSQQFLMSVFVEERDYPQLTHLLSEMSEISSRINPGNLNSLFVNLLIEVGLWNNPVFSSPFL